MIQDFAQNFFTDKQNANKLLVLEENLLSDDETTVLSSIESFECIFKQAFQKEILPVTSNIESHKKKFREWLWSRYEDFISNLLNYLLSSIESIQQKSLDTLMIFLKIEGEIAVKSSEKIDIWNFQKKTFEKIASKLILPDVCQQSLITYLEKHVEYDDVKFYLLRSVHSAVHGNGEVTDIFLWNCFLILRAIKYHNFDERYHSLLKKDGLTAFTIKDKAFLKLFSTTWLRFLKFQIPLTLCKKVLLIIHKNVLPHLRNPCILADFLSDSYKHGGVLSLLALNGLFFLMSNNNLEYPDFYIKLYSLVKPEIANGVYQDRFFYLLDLFLSSVLLSSSTLAAFAKRLSQIALTSNHKTTVKIISLITNLIIRHPSLVVLINRSDGEIANATSDPYDPAAIVPDESRAIESSLWELKDLQSSLLPEISQKAKLISDPLPVVEKSLKPDPSEGTTFQDIKFSQVYSAIEPPKCFNAWVL